MIQRSVTVRFALDICDRDDSHCLAFRPRYVSDETADTRERVIEPDLALLRFIVGKHAGKPTSALLSQQNAFGQHCGCARWDADLIQHLEERLARSTLPWLKLNNNRFGIGCNRLGALTTRPGMKGGSEKLARNWLVSLKHELESCLSDLLTSLWVLSARGMPLQAKRLISVGGKCNHHEPSCQEAKNY